MSFRNAARRRTWRDLLVGIAASLIAAAIGAALFSTCSGPTSLHFDLRVGAAAADTTGGAYSQ